MGFFSVFKKKKKDIVKQEEENIQHEQAQPDVEPEEVVDEELAAPVEVQETGLEEIPEEIKTLSVEDDDYIFEEPPAKKKGILARLKQGLSKTSSKIIGGMENILLGKKVINEELLEELEELFITSDIGVKTTVKIIDALRDAVDRKTLKNPEELKTALKNKILEILSIDNDLNETDESPYVILVVGVNGTGKTTSIAKLTNLLKNKGLSVMLAAGDTFRAAAIDQLGVWATRLNVPIVKQAEGSDPAAVIFDAVQSAKAKNFDVLIADTAGRLHTKFNLMNELKKVDRVIKKEMINAPHEVLLVLDATAGQNAIAQAKAFHEDIGVTGLILTKLDGTAKGGAIIGIVDEIGIPVKFIGFGESMEDLKPFNAKDFVDALFDAGKF